MTSCTCSYFVRRTNRGRHSVRCPVSKSADRMGAAMHGVMALPDDERQMAMKLLSEIGQKMGYEGWGG